MASRKWFYILLTVCLTACGGEPTTSTVRTSVQKLSKSPKRGVAFNFSISEDLPVLSPYISWDYNWGNTSSELSALWFDTNEMDYCPMCWNGNYSADAIRAYVAAHPATKYLLAFNEPNLTDQANMTPAQAAALWPAVVALAEELNLKLISPAMNYGTLAGYSDPIKWLDEFFEQPNVSLDDVYAISIHCYMGSAGAMAAFVQKFAKYNKPIWLTEFCAWENVNSVEAQMDYMSAALNYLETTELVERYAWFIPRWSKHNVSPYMELLTSGVESSLTDAGKVYCYFTNMSSSEYLETNRFIYAGEYCTLSNTNTTLRPCADAEAVLKAGKEGLMVSGLHTGNALTYHLAVPQFTNTITIRYASYIASIMEIYVDGQLANYLDMPKTGSYDNWTEAMTTAGIKAGYHEIELKMNSGSAYISGFLLQ